MDSRSTRVSGGLLLLLGALVAMCTLGAPWRYTAVALATAVPLVVLAAQLVRRTAVHRAGWALMLAGAASLLAHNTHNAYAVATTGSPAQGTVATVTLVLGYLLLIVGAVPATLPYTRRDGGGMLDAVLIGLAAASLLWGVVLHPAHVRLGSTPAVMADEMALALLVASLTGMVVRVAAVAREARFPALCLLAGMLATNVGDVGFTLTLDPATGLSAWWPSALCIVPLLALAAALVHPAVPALARSEPPPRGLTWRHLAFLGAALAVNPALAGLGQLLGREVDVLLFTAGSLLMVPLVVARIGLLARHQAEAERRLHDLATRDELTGLPNRRTLTAHLTGLLGRVAAGEVPGAVLLYLDLDEFKSVNDTHGHLAGDRLLQAVTARLRACVPAHALVARCGGDEFVVVLEGAPERAGFALADTIAQAMEEPVDLGGAVASGRVSVGLAVLGPGEVSDVEALLGRADAAMYQAKRARRGLVRPM
ncbi:diguanylate cyclase domain-containing protein [Cellulomonas soli]|uniref:diguanylate cyclase domain-containing protein n=1 Tax=Cellulomonas soli TaxID=931535 RepID=UPI003F847ED8